MAFVFAIPEAVLRGLYLNFRFLFKEGNPLFSESQTHLLERRYLFAFTTILQMKLFATADLINYLFVLYFRPKSMLSL